MYVYVYIYIYIYIYIYLLHYSVSHDSSEIILIYWFVAQETFSIIINVENIEKVRSR